MTDVEHQFARGGLVEIGLGRVQVDAAECLVRPGDVLAGRPVCVRRDPAHLEAAHPDWPAGGDRA